MSNSLEKLVRLMAASGLCIAALGPAVAAPFEFAPAPQTDLNRVYRIDKATGEVGACQFQLKEGGVGMTICFAAGEGPGRRRPATTCSCRRGTSARAASSASTSAPAR